MLGKELSQIKSGIVKTQPDLYMALGCDRDNFSNNVLVSRKIHGKSYRKMKENNILAHKMSISFHPADNDKLDYRMAYEIARQFAEKFMHEKGHEVLFAVHTDTPHKRNVSSMDYIYCIEPQARGAFHAHCVLIFDAKKAPFIPNADMAKLWRHGFTSTQSLKSIKNPGAYLSAYLCDMEVAQAARLGISGDAVKEVETLDENGEPVKKSVVKGARLKLMPKNVRLFRCSRGIKRPIVRKCTEHEAMQIVGDAPLVYEKTVYISDSEGKFINSINYRTFDRKGKSTKKQN